MLICPSNSLTRTPSPPTLKFHLTNNIRSNSSTVNSFLNFLDSLNRYTCRIPVIRPTSLVGNVSGTLPCVDRMNYLSSFLSHRPRLIHYLFHHSLFQSLWLSFSTIDVSRNPETFLDPKMTLNLPLSNFPKLVYSYCCTEQNISHWPKIQLLFNILFFPLSNNIVRCTVNYQGNWSHHRHPSSFITILRPL